MSSHSRTASSPAHIAQPGPATRQNTSTQWSHGVLSGGKLIDMLECLSATARPSDWVMAIWLQDHYIAPFGRVERLDGLIVANSTDTHVLLAAHERYIELVGARATVQRLWVPGLEPRYATSQPTELPDLPGRNEQKKWTGSEMYFKNGVEVLWRGVLVEQRKDGLNWDRKIWMAPRESAVRETDTVGCDASRAIGADVSGRKLAALTVRDGMECPADVEGMPSLRQGESSLEGELDSRSPTLSLGEGDDDEMLGGP